MVTKKLRLETEQDVLSVLGVQDSKLRQLESALRVEVFVRHDPQGGGVDITVRGSVSKVDKALARIRQMQACAAHAGLDAPPAADTERKAVFDGIIYRPAELKPVRPRSPRQREYIEAIFDHDLVIATGPAGTGKTFLAVAAALRAMELNLVERVILTRPIVEAGERLGFLPGDLYEKVHPYLRPLFDAFYSMLGPERFRSWREDGVVEILPLAYMRGRTLENAFIILDEAQNTVPEQMKMFLTRMGLNSRMVITGDLSQIDLKDKAQCGLAHAVKTLRRVPGIKFIEFGTGDVERHPLVREIVAAYARAED